MYGPTSIFNFNSLVSHYQFEAFFRKSSERSFSSRINQIKALAYSGILRLTAIKTFSTANISYCKIVFTSIYLELCLDLVCLLLFTRFIISQNSSDYPYMLLPESLNFSNRSYKFHVATTYRTFDKMLQRFQVC